MALKKVSDLNNKQFQHFKLKVQKDKFGNKWEKKCTIRSVIIYENKDDKKYLMMLFTKDFDLWWVLKTKI